MRETACARRDSAKTPAPAVATVSSLVRSPCSWAAPPPCPPARWVAVCRGAGCRRRPGRPAEEVDRVPGRVRVGQEHGGAGIGEDCRAPVAALRVTLGRGQRDDHREVAARRGRGRTSSPDRVGELRGRVRVGTVTEDEVEQQHAARGVAGLDGEAPEPQRRVDHRVRPPAGQRVVAEVDDDVAGVAQVGTQRQLRPERGVGTDVAEGLAGDDHRLVGQGPAAEEPAQRAPADLVARRPGPLRPGPLRPPDQLSDCGGQIRSTRPERRPVDRRAEPGGIHLEVGEHLGGGRLGHDDDALGGGVGGERRERLARGATAHRGGEVATPDAEAVAHADPRRVEQRHHLLGSGARRRDDADRAGSHDVGEAEGDAADDRGAAVGSQDEHAGTGGRVLECHLVLDGDVVGEDHDAHAGRDRVERLGGGVRTGHRDEREVGPHRLDGRARRARGRRLAEAGRRGAATTSQLLGRRGPRPR